MKETIKTPNCDMHEALVSFLYNEASPEDSRRVEDHLVACHACKQELGAFEQVRGMLQHWQLDDMPIVRVVTETLPGRRSALAVLKELFTVTPVWVKALSAAAMAMLVLAVMGTEVSIGRDGFSYRADILRRQSNVIPINATSDLNASDSAKGVELEQVRADVRALVGQMIAESERQQKEEIKAQLVSLQAELQNMHSSDLAKIATRIQEHQTKIRTIQRDIDRREATDLTDILFSELMSQPADRSTTVAKGGSD